MTRPARRGTSQEPKNGSSAHQEPRLEQKTAPEDRAVGFQAVVRLTEAQFQAQVIRYARLMGWTVWHDHDSRRNAAGLPDLILVRRPRLVWAELKSARGRVTPDQRAWIEELRACGQDARIWRPDDWPEIERVLR